MREFRKSKDCTEHYTSLEELRKAYGLKPVIRKAKDSDKLKSDQEKFLGTCKVCKHPLSWIENTNVCACKNPECKGFKMTSKNEEEGIEKVWYIPITKTLDEIGFQIAMNLFGE